MTEDINREEWNNEDLRIALASPTLKDEVYAMLNGLHRAGQLNIETVRILWPHLEDAVKWRKRDA